MDIESGIIIETVYYYGNMIETGEVSLEELGDFTKQLFYSIDSLTPCDWVGHKNGTIIASSGVEYFSYLDINSIHTTIREVKDKEKSRIIDFRN